MVCQLCHLKSSVDYRGGYEIVDNFSQSDSETTRFDSVTTYDNIIKFPDDVSAMMLVCENFPLSKGGRFSSHLSLTPLGVGIIPK